MAGDPLTRVKQRPRPEAWTRDTLHVPSDCGPVTSVLQLVVLQDHLQSFPEHRLGVGRDVGHLGRASNKGYPKVPEDFSAY